MPCISLYNSRRFKGGLFEHYYLLQFSDLKTCLICISSLHSTNYLYIRFFGLPASRLGLKLICHGRNQAAGAMPPFFLPKIGPLVLGSFGIYFMKSAGFQHEIQQISCQISWNTMGKSKFQNVKFLKHL